MKKVGIVGIIDNNNYGNRLQNYALSQVLSKYYLTETLKNSPENEFPFLKRNIKKMLYKLHILKRFMLKKGSFKRYIAFRNFNKKIPFSKKKYSSRNVLNSKYDFFVVGSDQVWNPYHGRLNDFDVLKNVDGNKCFSYSASFGVKNMDEEYIEVIKKNLSKFKKLSVRENEGKDILRKICNRDDIEVSIDPTMLLTVKEWDEIVPKNAYNKKTIIFVYFLGALDDKKLKCLNESFPSSKYDIINMLDNKSKYYKLGPEFFVYFIKNSKYVLTDSFHAVVFSILYNKNFYFFNRSDIKESMNSRIETLCERLNINLQISDFEKGFLINNIDYSNINVRIEKMREEAINYIEKMFD